MRTALLFIAATMVGAIMLWALILFMARSLRWARKGSAAATVIGWALLLLGAGINPQPPPQYQVEEANRQKRIKKEAASSDPEDHQRTLPQDIGSGGGGGSGGSGIHS